MPFQLNFLNNNSILITNAEACVLRDARNAYNYPYIKMRLTGAVGDIELTHGVWATFDSGNRHTPTELSLDSYHTNLLHSGDPIDQLLGIASIIYWGFFTFNDNFARVRVERFLRGHGAIVGTTPAMAATVVQAALSEYRESGNFGNVLAVCHGVSQLGRTPFASKFVAFLLPEYAGVYDNRLNNALRTRVWSRAADFIGAIGSVKAARIQTRYHDWTDQLRHIAQSINAGIDLGFAWHWTSRELGQQRWRALDVERALFHLVA